MTTGAPLLSVALLVGPRRERSQHCLDLLGRQSAAASIEIVLLDLAPAGTPRLKLPPGVQAAYRAVPPGTGWGAARVEAVRLARAPVVAFVEDHAYAAPDWAERLIEAHEGPWVAVGYAFTNANPNSYLGRAGMTIDYGLWQHPAQRGRATHLAGNNVSYKRAALLALGERLENMLTPDFVLQEWFRQQRQPMFIEARAVVAHEHFEHLGGLLTVNYLYGRLLGAQRSAHWSFARRLAYGVAVPPLAPWLMGWRLLRSVRRRPSLWPAVLASLPVFALARVWLANGEGRGYLFGSGTVHHELERLEYATERRAS